MSTDTLTRAGAAAGAQSWNDGYFVQSTYINHAYRILCPHHLSAALMMNGIKAPRTDRPFTYLELGCGNGVSTAFFAAANPHATFYAADFMPEHISYANRFARDAHLDNATFMERSFEELQQEDIPPCDFIVMHGVYSWISDTQRQHIQALLKRYLKPGGICYVSYNAKPGDGFLSEPIRRFLLEFCRARGNSSEPTMRAAMQALQDLTHADSALGRTFPAFADKVGGVSGKDIRYLMHEFMNGNHKAFYCTEVMDAMAESSLTFGGAAKLIQNRKSFILSPESHAFFQSAPDTRNQELYSDYLRNNGFRSDIYHRGAASFSQHDLQERLDEQRFMLARARGQCGLNVNIPGGSIGLQAEVYTPMLDALAASPLTLSELRASHSVLRQKTFGEMLQYLFTLLAVDFVQFALPEAGRAERFASTMAFNEANMQRGMEGQMIGMVASPVSGNAEPCDAITQCFLKANQEGADNPADYVARMLHKLGVSSHPAHPSEPLPNVLARQHTQFCEAELPHLKQLGIVLDHG